MATFHPLGVWDRFMTTFHTESNLTLFMAVPTIYALLANEFDKFDKNTQQKAKESLSRLRLMVSGSMALPQPLFERWEQISGHRLLERYGMTEIGMTLSNPLSPTSERIAGTVGKPFEGVNVKIKTDNFEQEKGSVRGELLVKSDQVFSRYHNKPEATKETFDEEGWFITGDIAEYDENKQTYKILGRASVDIIKSGGYKISALEIERELLSYPNISEVAVVGVENEIWGQTIYALIVLKNSKIELNISEITEWMKQRMASYKVPKKFIILNNIPKNAMGKINKKELVKSDIIKNATKE